MGLLSNPHILVELYLTRFPASLGTTTVKLTTGARPVSIVGGFYEPRIDSVGEITRSCTDQDGSYQVGFCDLVCSDQDGSLATLLEAGTATEYWYAREAVIWVLSREGLTAGLTPFTTKPVFRGWISSVQRNRRKVTIRISDVVGSQMSGFNLDKRVLRVAAKDLTSNYREENKDRKIPIYIGEFSDRGAPPINGESVLKGLLPVIEVGEIDPATLLPPPAAAVIEAPIITGSGFEGSGGEKSLSYAATLITPFGESGLSNIVTVNGAASRSLGNFNWIQGTYNNGGSSPFNRVRIWVSDSADPTSFHLWLDEANYTLPGPNTFAYADGAAPMQYPSPVFGVTRDELDSAKELTPPPSAATSTGNWSIMAICLGNEYDILDVYASDLADGTAPRRKLIDSGDRGSTFITPDDAEWPFPHAWIELNGIRITGFLARGLKLQAHRDGTVTMAVNLCGPHGSNGKVINQAFFGMQFLLNEHCLKNKGTGYTNVDYGTLEPYANSDAILKTSQFLACQNQSITWIGDLGYLCSIWIVDENETWRDVLSKFCKTFGCRFGVNRYGQILPGMVPSEPDGVTGRHFRERIEIKRMEDGEMNYEQIVNKFNISYFYDPDAGRFRSIGQPFPNNDSIAAHVPGGVVGGTDKRGLKEQDRDLAYTSDAATATDVPNRELLRRKRRPRYPVFTVGMLGLDHDLFERGRLTDSFSGLGVAGDQATETIILQHVTRLDAQEITLTVQDIDSIGEISGPVGDESDSSAVTVNDELTVPPTALEVG